MAATAPSDLLQRFDARLDERERALIADARAWCDAAGAGLYLVGGSVRDLLLGRAHLDLDLAIEGDAAALAQALAAPRGARVTVHAHFGTAVIEGEGWSLDIARTRREQYTYPGALPLVEPAPIAADLARRDFTIQAMALALTGDAPGALLDPLGGQADLAACLLRVLHRDSFRDDPTRILRLARYAARLGFGVEAETAALARHEAAFLAELSPARIAAEFARTFAEPLPELTLALLGELHALRPIYPPLHQDGPWDEPFARLRDDGGPPPAMADYLCTIAAAWARPAIQGLGDQIELDRAALAALHDLPAVREALRTLTERDADPVAVVDALARLALPAVRGAGAATAGARARLVRRYLRDWRNVRPLLRGDELLALGVPAGPTVGEALRLLCVGRLRGELRTDADERQAIARWLAAERHCDG